MTGRDEDRCTYPVFLKFPDGRLVFQYRSGSSGDGDTLFNVYDVESRSWRRLVDGPILDGERKRNAYPHPPLLGPDGRFHLSWIWRDTPDAAANHDLSYARSRDLVEWEGADGRPVTLPITLATPGMVVDPVPVGGGILDGTGRVGFDSRHRPVLDAESLAVVRTEPATRRFPASLPKAETPFPGLRARFADDQGSSGVPGQRYILRWKALGANRDQPRKQPWPPPTPLRVVEIREAEPGPPSDRP